MLDIRNGFSRRIAGACFVGMCVALGAACYGSSTAPSVGTVTGVVTSSLGPKLANVEVDVTPTGLATVKTNTAADGSYAVHGLVGTTGTVALSMLPGGCTTPTPVAYVLAAQDSAAVDFLVSC
jgi:hypothetical protein